MQEILRLGTGHEPMKDIMDIRNAKVYLILGRTEASDNASRRHWLPDPKRTPYIDTMIIVSRDTLIRATMKKVTESCKNRGDCFSPNSHDE